MSKSRLIITAVTVTGRPVTEVAKHYKVSRQWVHRLLARYHLEGETAFEPGSTKPKTSPNTTSSLVVDRIVELRHELTHEGLDAGAHTIASHLKREDLPVPAVSTIHRVLRNAGLVVDQKHKRPRSSWIRFEATQPNECWQSDFTHWRLTDGNDVEILNFLDDHSRFLLASRTYTPVTGLAVADLFIELTSMFGVPASTLTDNGMVYTTRYATGAGGRCKFETILQMLGVKQKNGAPGHPQTQGKIERFHQTLKRYLAAHGPYDTHEDLQTVIDQFRVYYNQQRPHRALDRRTPLEVYEGTEKATASRLGDPHWRVRTDKIDKTGKVTLRVSGKLVHVGVGRPWAGTPIIMLIKDLDVTVVHLNTGEVLHHLMIDPSRGYQPQTM
jgi:transposase InsO family protein